MATLFSFSKLLKPVNGDGPLYGRLLASLEAAIQDGRLTPGSRLPSERDLAEELGLSRTTVTSAYRELEARGLVRGHVGRGTFVCAPPQADEAPFAWRGKVSLRVQRSSDRDFHALLQDSVNPSLISFAAGCPALDCFPFDDYQRIAQQVMKREGARVLGLAPTEGQPALRHALAARMDIKLEKVLVVSGSQQALDLLARCLLDPGDTVLIERPSYVGAIRTFRAAGASLVGWDVRRNDLDELEDLILRYRPKLFYINPTFQNPTGRTLGLPERRDLLKLAARYRLPVIEDGAYRELWFEGPPPASLRRLDEHNVVISLNTFSKVLAPGLRLGWIVASESIVEQLAETKVTLDHFTEGLGQLVVAEMLRSGVFDEHLKKLRLEHRRRRDALVAALRRELSRHTLEFTVPGGGLYLWCRLAPHMESAALLRAGLAAGVVFADGQLFYPDSAPEGELRLCYSALPVAKIEEGVRRLARCLSSAELRRPAAVRQTLPMV
ncbi:MAG TPA: PLP-dependent aminotransferase family protein [Terriglobales bacterium]|nr:PLP-dependent aminotransferase family protein [Terriglobales bacterium]